MATEDDRFEPPRRSLPLRALGVAAAVVVIGVIALAVRPDGSGDLAVDDDPSPSPDEGQPQPPEPPEPPPDDGPETDPEIPEASGSWSSVSEAPLSPRRTPPAWTGHELVVWGGHQEGRYESPHFEDGAAYDPDTHEWREIAPAPIGPRGGHVAVWADEELLVWGGEDRTRLHDDGAAYDPRTDSWTTIPPGPLSPRRDAVAGWVGGELIVAGGYDNAGQLTDAAAYDPDAREWRAVTDDLPRGFASPEARGTVRNDAFYVWSAGTEPDAAPTLWRFDPATDDWDERDLPTADPGAGLQQWITAGNGALVTVAVPGPGGRPRLAVHDGDEWQEEESPSGWRDPASGAPSPFSGVAAVHDGRVYVLDDADEPLRYDVSDDTWVVLPPIEPVAATDRWGMPQHHQAVSAGDHVLVWLGGLRQTGADGEGSPAGVVVWR